MYIIGYLWFYCSLINSVNNSAKFFCSIVIVFNGWLDIVARGNMDKKGVYLQIKVCTWFCFCCIPERNWGKREIYDTFFIRKFCKILLNWPLHLWQRHLVFCISWNVWYFIKTWLNVFLQKCHLDFVVKSLLFYWEPPMVCMYISLFLVKRRKKKFNETLCWIKCLYLKSCVTRESLLSFPQWCGPNN